MKRTRLSPTEQSDALRLIGLIYEAALQPGMWESIAPLITAFVQGGEFRELPVTPQYQPLSDSEHDKRPTKYSGHPATSNFRAVINSVVWDMSLATGDREHLRAQTLMPHLSRALAIMSRLSDAEHKTQASFATLEMLSRPTAFIDAQRRVGFANQAARRILEEADGLKLRRIRPGSKESTLYAEDPRSQAAIETALTHCLTPSLLNGKASGVLLGVAVTRPSGQRPYFVQFSTVGRTSEMEPGVRPSQVMVIISDPDASQRLDPVLLRRLFRMTAAETRLAEFLCSGCSLAEAAQEIGISLATARTHLKNMFKKTHVTRQAGLIRLLPSVTSTNRI